MLAERFAAGDDAAFAVLYERHRSSVLAICMGILGCRHDAEDAAQEVFATLATALRNEAPRDLRAWLLRVARNAAIDSARRRRPRAAAVELADPGDAPDAGIRAELDSVMAAIRELPASQRTALLMRELAGHSYQEIARLLEIDEEAVRGLIARARIGLRNLREAAELPCASARAALAAEPDGRRRDKVVRRHLRHCASCQAYGRALRADARALRCLDASVPAGGLAGSGALVGAAAKGLIAGGVLTQAGAACAVSICSAGGIALLAPHLLPHPRPGSHRTPVRRARVVAVRRGPKGLRAAGAAVGGPGLVALSVAPARGLTAGGEGGVLRGRASGAPAVAARRVGLGVSTRRGDRVWMTFGGTATRGHGAAGGLGRTGSGAWAGGAAWTGCCSTGGSSAHPASGGSDAGRPPSPWRGTGGNGAAAGSARWSGAGSGSAVGSDGGGYGGSAPAGAATGSAEHGYRQPAGGAGAGGGGAGGGSSSSGWAAGPSPSSGAAAGGGPGGGGSGSGSAAGDGAGGSGSSLSGWGSGSGSSVSGSGGSDAGGASGDPTPASAGSGRAGPGA